MLINVKAVFEFLLESLVSLCILDYGSGWYLWSLRDNKTVTAVMSLSFTKGNLISTIKKQLARSEVLKWEKLKVGKHYPSPFLLFLSVPYLTLTSR